MNLMYNIFSCTSETDFDYIFIFWCCLLYIFNFQIVLLLFSLYFRIFLEAEFLPSDCILDRLGRCHWVFSLSNIFEMQNKYVPSSKSDNCIQVIEQNFWKRKICLRHLTYKNKNDTKFWMRSLWPTNFYHQDNVSEAPNQNRSRSEHVLAYSATSTTKWYDGAMNEQFKKNIAIHSARIIVYIRSTELDLKLLSQLVHLSTEILNGNVIFKLL